MVHTYHRELHLPRRPSVIDTDDAENIIAAIVEELDIDEKQRGRLPSQAALQDLFSLEVNKGITLEAALEEKYPQFLGLLPDIKRVRVEYATFKFRNAYLDFDDLLVLLLALLRNPATAQRIRRRYNHVLVDEFQDTNHLQGQITLALVEEHKNVMVVGDDAQGIYSWRGAKIGNILEFPKRLPGCEVINLEDNYRSTQAILDTANAVLTTMRDAYSKTMRAAIGGKGEKPRLHVFLQPAVEAEYIADRLQEAIGAGESLRDFAVLYRNGAVGYPLQAELTRRKIPYVVRGGSKLTDAQHVKDALAYLRVLENPRDELAWLRMLKLLPRVGPKTARKIYRAITGGDGVAELEVAPNPLVKLADLHRNLPADTAYKDALGALAAGLFNASTQATLVETYDAILQHYQALMPDLFKNPERRLEDLGFLRTVVAGYQSAAALLDDLTLEPIEAKKEAMPPGEEWDIDPVVLSTIHSAKGLEWKHVYLLGVNDGILPGYRSLQGAGDDGTSEALEEEKRLLYVAITRAMRRLDICFSILSPLGRSSRLMHDLSRFLSADAVQATLERVEHTEEKPLTEVDILTALTGGLTE